VEKQRQKKGKVGGIKRLVEVKQKWELGGMLEERQLEDNQHPEKGDARQPTTDQRTTKRKVRGKNAVRNLGGGFCPMGNENIGGKKRV